MYKRTEYKTIKSREADGWIGQVQVVFQPYGVVHRQRRRYRCGGVSVDGSNEVVLMRYEREACFSDPALLSDPALPLS